MDFQLSVFGGCNAASSLKRLTEILTQALGRGWQGSPRGAQQWHYYRLKLKAKKKSNPPSSAELKGLLIQLNESEFPWSQAETPHISGRGPAAGEGFLSAGTPSSRWDGFWDGCPPGRVTGAGGTCHPATPARGGAALLPPEGGSRAWGQVVKNAEMSI